jgi:hypothetical protein
MVEEKGRHDDHDSTEDYRMRGTVPPDTSPWYVKIAFVLENRYGPLIVILAVFIGWWSGLIPSPITQNLATSQRIEAKIDTAVSTMRAEVIDSHRSDEMVIRILLATCTNIAKGDAAGITRCQDYWKR